MHVNFFVFPAIFGKSRCAEIQEILLPWQREVTTSPLSIGLPFTDRSRLILTLFSFFDPLQLLYS